MSSSSNEILCLENFIPSADCDHLVECFERLAPLLFKNPAGDPFWDHRYLWITSLPPAEARARAVMQDARRRIVFLLRGFYGERSEIYSDTIQLVKWKPGQSMPPHADNTELDGRPNATPFRDFASVVYLNDGYRGGELCFTRLGRRIAPRKAMLVAFRGGVEHAHGVSEIEGGLRYTMPGWFTRDIKHRDPSELEEPSP